MDGEEDEHIYFSYKHLFCKNQINNSLLNVIYLYFISKSHTIGEIFDFSRLVSFSLTSVDPVRFSSKLSFRDFPAITHTCSNWTTSSIRGNLICNGFHTDYIHRNHTIIYIKSSKFKCSLPSMKLYT